VSEQIDQKRQTRTCAKRSPLRKIDLHPNRKQIIDEIRKGVPFIQISKKYDIPRTCLSEWARDAYLKQIKQDSFVQYPIKEQLEYLQIETKKMIDACKRVLQDPDDPDSYDFSARASEVCIIYADSKGRHHKTTLDDLLVLIDQSSNDYSCQRWFYASEDPRRVLLKAIEVMRGNIETMAKVSGDIKDIQINVDIRGQLIPTIINVITDSIRDNPELQQKIVQGITDAVSASGGQSL